MQKHHEQISWTTKRTSAICTGRLAQDQNISLRMASFGRGADRVKRNVSDGLLTRTIGQGKTESAQSILFCKLLKLNRFIVSGVVQDSRALVAFVVPY